MAHSLPPSGRGGLLKAAKEDYYRVIEADADLLRLRGDGNRKRSA
jgi:hypothetical protein